MIVRYRLRRNAAAKTSIRVKTAASLSNASCNRRKANIGRRVRRSAGTHDPMCNTIKRINFWRADLPLVDPLDTPRAAPGRISSADSYAPAGAVG